MIQRRPFLKTALGATLAAGFARAQDNPPPAKKLGWALVGLGSLSTNQIAPALLKTTRARLAAVVTGRPQIGIDWRAKYDLPAERVYSYETFDRIIEDPAIDVVCISCPTACTTNSPSAPPRPESMSTAKNPWPTPPPSAAK